MELNTAIQLIAGGITAEHPQTWLDLGCGTGLFSRALACLLPANSTVHAIDKNEQYFEDLDTGHSTMIKPARLDFVKDDLPWKEADGILMANSLHFVKDKVGLLQRLSKNLSAHGVFVIVEYEMTIPNPWVPYPVGFAKLQSVCRRIGWQEPGALTEAASSFSGRTIYSAMAKPY